VFECTGFEIAVAAINKIRKILCKKGRGIFIFASNHDFRILGTNPLNLHGYTRDEVDKMFDDFFSSTYVDTYSTTYEGGIREQRDWLVTIVK